jgi:hypothetical protein
MLQSSYIPHRWIKCGVLLAPFDQSAWRKSHVGPSFVDTGDRMNKLYVTGRDSDNCSHIGIFDLEVAERELKVLMKSERLVFSPGELGTFDESGVSYPWIVHYEGRIFMYYVGWVAGGRTRFQNYTGLAISDDGGATFKRARNVPILDRNHEEPFGSGSCAVWVDHDGWKMIYTSFEPWTSDGPQARPCYRLKEALSDDGISWHRTGRVVIDFAHPEEHIIGKPMVLQDGDVTRLWYSHRGTSYRIGYAESTNGRDFVRMDERVGIDVSPNGWDSEMIEYAYVFDHNGDRFMIYNGNDFGKTGLGYARLEHP